MVRGHRSAGALVGLLVLLAASPSVGQDLRQDRVRSAPIAPAGSIPGSGTQPTTRFRDRFMAASHDTGRLTLREARSAGLTELVADFPAIDRRGRGAITLQDVREYLRTHPGSSIPRSSGED